MTKVVTIGVILFAIATGISYCKPAQYNSYEFKPKNNPTWTCYAVRRDERSPVFCTPDAPGYAR